MASSFEASGTVASCRPASDVLLDPEPEPVLEPEPLPDSEPDPDPLLDPQPVQAP